MSNIDLEHEPKGPGAKFRFGLSDDGMKLGVTQYTPPGPDGEGPTVARIRRQVAEAGVTLPIDAQAAKRIIKAISNGEEFRNIVLVRGLEAREPSDAKLMTRGDLDFPVFPGATFIRKTPPLGARAGQTIDGRILEPRSHAEPKDLKVEAGNNCSYDHLEGVFVSQVYGLARVTETTVSVDPALHISDDMVTITGTLFHRDFSGSLITPAEIEKELRDLGVVIDVCMDEISIALTVAREIGLPQPDVVLVEGKHPVPGRDGWLEYLVSTREVVGTEDEHGRVNFRDRGAYPMVEADQVIARIHPPTQGEGGIDIYGKTIPASMGNVLRIHPGEGVELQEDEITFSALDSGIMVVDRDVLSITQCLLIREDVDIAIGNVQVGLGSVKVLGSVMAGSLVSAPQHVIINGVVEGARVYAGGNVEVGGGILMPEPGMVRAEGDVVANYATNARIEAGGNVVITSDITNSVVSAGGKVIVSRGKGLIQGGCVTCGKGMEVNELGSELGVPTRICVGLMGEQDDWKELDRLTSDIKRIDDTLGDGLPETILFRTPDTKKESVAMLLQHRKRLMERRQNLDARLTGSVLRHQRDLAGLTIKVFRTIHPGVTICFGTKEVTVKKTMERSVIYWYSKGQQIVFGVL